MYSLKRRTPARVALVNMPFASTRYPSFQLGLLHAVLRDHGFQVETRNLNLKFAAQLGWERYEFLATAGRRLYGEWLFARAAFGQDAPDAALLPALDADGFAQYCDDIELAEDMLIGLRECVAPAFIDQCAAEPAWAAFDVVCFGTVYAQNCSAQVEQHCASLALAWRLKERYPNITTVFTGAHVQGEMGEEYVRVLSAIDYALTGEAEETLPVLLDHLVRGEAPVCLPGVARRTAQGVTSGGRAPLVREMDNLPEPDYDDFFQTAHELEMPATVQGKQVLLLFESARGCWWGERQHCTYCGLNGLGMAFRSKAPARVLANLDQLAERYGVRRFAAVDMMMDRRYPREVFGPLAEQGKGYTLFYEVKSNLTREQLALLARGGVRKVQPGIESFSTRLLTLMNKGATALQNVRLLKWATYYGIDAGWNILLGFPGETLEDYTRQLEIVRRIPHLQPPLNCDRLWLERYSPNFDQAAERGITKVRPLPEYGCIYPEALHPGRIAHYFEYDAADTMPQTAHWPLFEQVRLWQKAWQDRVRPYLTYLTAGELLLVMDGRDPSAPRTHSFGALAARIYSFCSPTYRTLAGIYAYLRDDCHLPAESGAVEAVLDEFIRCDLMLMDDSQFFSLGLPPPPSH